MTTGGQPLSGQQPEPDISLRGQVHVCTALILRILSVELKSQFEPCSLVDSSSAFWNSAERVQSWS